MSDAPVPRTVAPHPSRARGLLLLPEVMRLTKLGQTEVYARMNAGTFPVPRQVGLRKVAWLAGEVLDWIEALPKWAPNGRHATDRTPEG